ncbi:Smr/MutS family protein [Metamycoplasma canadense]|uniref:Smr/MutS family protein n=1 Tax=Metamycoplasma canadense TaxID=29554 RepID=UPI00069406BD|nr:Smr/MutS family protein [Metamycoplasma canadense]
MSFSSFTIDLHGQTGEKAVATVLNALFTFEQDKYLEYFDIIVGNGVGALKFYVSDLLDSENYSYQFINSNHSIIRVFKK